MSDCCIETLEKLLKALSDQYKPKDGDPNTPMTEKEFYQFEVVCSVASWVSKHAVPQRN
jgi:hypothetical protein